MMYDHGNMVGPNAKENAYSHLDSPLIDPSPFDLLYYYAKVFAQKGIGANR